MEDRTEQPHSDSAGRGGDALPLESIIDAVRHPWDANSILERAIAVWDSDPATDIVIILLRGDAKPMENRLRVKLAAIRKQLKQGGGTAIKQFGFETTTINWTLEDGTQREALCLSRVVHTRHIAIEAFDAILGAKKP